jgi:P4 family phage/plasmid primase-like protien
VLAAALEYAAAGLSVIPLHGAREDGSCTCGDSQCGSPGKHPRTKNGLNDATTDPKQIKKWWGEDMWPNASIAGVGGKFLCLDVDVRKNGDTSLERMVADNAPLPDTAISETGVHEGKRGRHYWFKVPSDRQVASKTGIRKGIDIRCSRGYAVLPPSTHASGVNYQWITEFSEVQVAPEWLLDLAPEAIMGDSTWAPNPKFRMAKDVRDFLSGKYEVPAGEQRDFLTRAARSVLTTGKTVDEASDLLYEGNDGDGGITACEASREPWTHEEILYLVEDVFRKPPTSEMMKEFAEEGYTWDDWGNAQRLVDAFQENAVFHVHEWSKWYIWDPEAFTWSEDDGTVIRRTWEEITKKLWDDSFGTDDKSFIRFVSKSRSRGATESTAYLARDYVRKKPTELNANPFLLNCTNGVLDLREGKLLPGDPGFFLTKQVRAEYVPGAQSDLWDKIIRDLIPLKELRDFVQKVFGYTLTGSTEEHKFFYFHGPPGAGKTTLLESFAYLMGNYSEACEPSTFMQNRQEGGPTEDIARLSNARMVTTHEVDEGARWAEARVAHLTGGDKVTARFLHQNSFEFYPQFKLFFSANHKPRVSGSGNSGLWRRLIIVPVDRVIPESERDPMLLRKLRQPEVLSAVLAWAVEGCRKWMEDYQAGRLMEVPQIVRDEVEEYKAEENHVMQFLEDMILRTEDLKDRVPKPEFYKYYRAWCEENGRRQYYTTHRLTKEMNALGFEAKPASSGGKVRDCWMMLKIKGIKHPEVD